MSQNTETEHTPDTFTHIDATAPKKKEYERLNPEDLVIVGLDTEVDPEHPLYDRRAKMALEEPFYRNVERVGIQTPIQATLIDGKPHVVAGRQRVKALRAVNRERAQKGLESWTIPVVWVAGSAHDLAARVIIENEARHETNAMNRIESMLRLEAHGYDNERLADIFKVGPQTLDQWRMIALGHPSVKKALRDGKLATTTAFYLAKMPQEEQAAEIEKMAETGQLIRLADVQRKHQEKRLEKTGDGDKGAVAGVVLKQKKNVQTLLALVNSKIVEAEEQEEQVDRYYEGLADALRLFLGEAPKNRKEANSLLRRAKLLPETAKAPKAAAS